MKTLNQIVCVMLSINLWTGRKKLDISDLKNVNRSQIPPDKLASLGSKRIVDPAKIKIFSTLKRRADRACLAVGTRFLGGYAIPLNELDALTADLEIIKGEFYRAQGDFIASYDKAVEEWIQDNPEWSVSIRTSVDPVSVIKHRLSFNYQAFKVSEMGPEYSHEANDGLSDVVDGLGNQLIHEINRQAQEAWRQSYSGRTSVGQKALRPLVSMADKLEGLSFVDSRVSVMAQSIRDCLAALPKRGPIEGQNFNAVCGIMSMLSDSNSVVRAPVQQWSLLDTSQTEEVTTTEVEVSLLPEDSQPDVLSTGCSW